MLRIILSVTCKVNKIFMNYSLNRLFRLNLIYTSTSPFHHFTNSKKPCVSKYFREFWLGFGEIAQDNDCLFIFSFQRSHG